MHMTIRSMKKKHVIKYADDDSESIWDLFLLRAPILGLGCALGIGISFMVSHFEEVLQHNVQVAFFLPFVVYIAASIGTQTEAIYSRDLKSGKAMFAVYLYKEFFLGLLFGLLFGIFSFVVSFLWLSQVFLSLSVGIASFLAIGMAPVLAVFVTEVFQYMGKDPAVGSGPIGTVIQDVASVVIYGLVTSIILL